MSKHVLRPHVCPWCHQRFDARHGVKAHIARKHKRNMPLTEEARAELALEKYNRAKQSEAS
jgi:hypothetical protein